MASNMAVPSQSAHQADAPATAGPSETRKAVNPAASTSNNAAKKDEPPRPPPPAVLKGDRICIAEKQFSQTSMDPMIEVAGLLGAPLVPQSECTILLVNPHSSAYKEEMAQMAAVKLKYPKHAQPMVLPYHWLLTCLARRTRVDPSGELTVASPILVHPDRSLDHAPLKIWVSVNLHRTESEEDAEDTQSHVQKELLERGALIVDKRAIADILVVDRNSRFFSNTILKERQKYGRQSQRIVERDWVEDCVKKGKMSWPPMEQDPVAKEEVDSMAEDEPLPVGKRPGRPAGKPRVDYTPADGDFLCRYLAFFHPGGSWLSRKTYQMMIAMTDQFPIISRHSDQSWHEHFKKNAGTYEARVRRYIAESLDRTLKTEKERQTERAKKQAERERQEAHAALNGGGDIGGEIPSAPAPALSPRAAKAQAVRAPPQAGPSGTHQTVAEREGARLTQIAAAAVGVSTVTATDASTSHDVVMEPSSAQAQDGPETKRKGLLGTAKETTTPQASPSNVPQAAPIQPAVRVSATQPGKPTPHEPMPKSLPDHPPAKSTPPSKIVPAPLPDQPHQPQPPAKLPQPNQSVDTAPIPSVAAEAAIESTPAVSNNTPSHPAQQPRAIPGEKRRFATPAQTPGRRESLMKTGIRSSESKRRRMLERAAYGGRIPAEPVEPDTIAVSVAIVPASEYIASRSATPVPAVRPPTPRSPSPRLSRREREAKVALGHQRVKELQEEYGQRVKQFAIKYNMMPSGIVKLMDEINALNRGGGGGQMFWDNVEQGLKERFGF